MEDLSRTFGNKDVATDERERLIRRVFSNVAPRYDLMNDLMSMGIHRLWKRTLARRAAPAPGQVVVDLAGGTGDVAARMSGPDRTVVVCDPSTEMMQVGLQRELPNVGWLAGTGEMMPLADSSVDTVTIAFGIRNVSCMDSALTEILRVLRPGGRFLCLEFSTPVALVRPAYELFSRTVIPRLGAWVSRNEDAYHYLIESIRRFPDQNAMKEIMQGAGFTDVSWRNFSMGIACLHIGTRPAS
jgi:demethylmenaquinone methyltransferase/2-methoxy-6-polyprenyl-1,4-benzoquinol methylase